MSHPFDAFAEALGSTTTEAAPVRSAGDVMHVARPAELARALHGIRPGAKLPALGTARRAGYERDRREARALAAGKRPSRGLARRTERSLRSPRGRVRELVRERTKGTRSASRKAAALRRDGGGLGFRGTVIVSKDREDRTMPAGAESGRLQELEPDAWGRVLDAFEAGDRDEFADVLANEFGEAYGVELSIEDVEELWIE